MEKKYKFQDEAFSFQERAKDLVDQMTIEEAASQMLFEAAKIERLGVQIGRASCRERVSSPV